MCVTVFVDIYRATRCAILAIPKAGNITEIGIGSDRRVTCLDRAI